MRKIMLFGTTIPLEGSPNIRQIAFGPANSGPVSWEDLVMIRPAGNQFEGTGWFVYHVDTGLYWVANHDGAPSRSIETDTMIFDGEGSLIVAVKFLDNGGYEVTLGTNYAPQTWRFEDQPEMSWQAYVDSLTPKDLCEPAAIVRWFRWFRINGGFTGLLSSIFGRIRFRYAAWKYAQANGIPS